MDKVDYKKQLKQYYDSKVDQPRVVEVPKMMFLKIDGAGSPADQEYANAIQTLYPVAYAIKFICKKELERDYGVMPLEGLWWAEDMTVFSTDDKSDWLWTAMIMQPDFVTKQIFTRAVEQVRSKKNPVSLDKIRFEEYDEGRAAQVMYVGPYSDEGPTINKLHAFLESQGGILDGSNKHHHEIYLGDPRRTVPEKLKTIIRQPF